MTVSIGIGIFLSVLSPRLIERQARRNARQSGPCNQDPESGELAGRDGEAAIFLERGRRFLVGAVGVVVTAAPAAFAARRALGRRFEVDWTSDSAAAGVDAADGVFATAFRPSPSSLATADRCSE
jgi:hypothetical protein